MKIDKGVKIPPSGIRKVTAIGRLVREMEEGDSIVFDTEREALSARSALRYLGRGSAQRKSSEGWRIWRMADIPQGAKSTKRITRTQSIQPTTSYAAPIAQIQPFIKAAPIDESQVTALHGFALASSLKVSIDEVKQWVAIGVSEDDLRSAINRSRSTAGVVSADAVRRALEAA